MNSQDQQMKAVALDFAIKQTSSGGKTVLPDEVIELAEKFYVFLSGAPKKNV